MNKIITQTINTLEVRKDLFMKQLKNDSKQEYENDTSYHSVISYETFYQANLENLKDGIAISLNGNVYEYIKENDESACFYENKIDYYRLAKSIKERCYDIAKDNGRWHAETYLDLHIEDTTYLDKVNVETLCNEIDKDKNVGACTWFDNDGIEVVFKNVNHNK